jgi:hypothetical protein
MGATPLQDSSPSGADGHSLPVPNQEQMFLSTPTTWFASGGRCAPALIVGGASPFCT